MKEEVFTMQTKKHTLTKLIAILGLFLWAGACHGHRPLPAASEEKPTLPPPAAPAVTLTAEPSNIQSGSATTLSWTSQNATDLDLSPTVGKVQAAGSTSVTLQDSTTFTITAKGPGGTETATARVTVMPPPVSTQTKPTVTDQGLTSDRIKDAYFDFDKANIRSDAEQALGVDAGLFKDHPDVKFTLEGYCDERGSEEYNLALGDRRANAAKDFLVNAGVSPDRINTISYGKSKPVCTDQTEECWQKNRRAHVHYGEASQ
jgi:peptidoglycan-associated lipoprotein